LERSFIEAEAFPIAKKLVIKKKKEKQKRKTKKETNKRLPIIGLTRTLNDPTRWLYYSGLG
jgi:hypothetical protein